MSTEAMYLASGATVADDVFCCCSGIPTHYGPFGYQTFQCRDGVTLAITTNNMSANARSRHGQRADSSVWIIAACAE
eukprot:7594858-Pyramimonas_sp.AAC.1